MQNLKIKKISNIKDTSSLISCLSFFPYIKRVKFEKDNDGKIILRIRLPWYYLFPYSTFKLFEIEKKMKEQNSPGFNFEVKNYWL